MREISEYTAEVFRRSEKRIKEQKKRRMRILSVCIPICAVITLWSASLLPAMLPANSNKAFNAENVKDSNGSFQNNSSYLVEVVGSDYLLLQYCAVEEGDKADGIYSELMALFELQNTEDIQTSTSTKAENEDKKTSSADTPVYSLENRPIYKMSYIGKNGEKTVFIIEKDKLINESANEEVEISEEQYMKILKMLGIVIETEGGK